MTTIGLIRHGTTEWNLLGKMQGQTDIPLADVGIRQAELLADRLAAERWDGVISSDLSRAEHTARLIAERSGFPVIGTDARLRERSFGQLEGTTEADRIARWGDRWRELHLGQESDDELMGRGMAVLTDLVNRYPQGRLLLVSHGGLLVPLLKKLTGDPMNEFLGNTSFSVLRFADSAWQCELLNCSAHLAPLEYEAH